MKELVVISGKGGTGKTSIVASFAALASHAAIADCDVDAADLHLVLAPQVIRRKEFTGGGKAVVDPDLCAACGKCAEVCRFGAVLFDGPSSDVADKTYRVDPMACEGCGVCEWSCPAGAIDLAPTVNGEWFVSQTRHGPMVHAALGFGAGNSGKLVSIVRSAARELAKSRGLQLIIIDGSPGIGCPVIASVTGASAVLIVAEPTLSSMHDLERVADLAAHFVVPAMVCINKWDINDSVASRIEKYAARRGLAVAGRVRYDPAVTEAQVAGKSVVELRDASDGVADDIHRLWQRVLASLYPAGVEPRAAR